MDTRDERPSADDNKRLLRCIDADYVAARLAAERAFVALQVRHALEAERMVAAAAEHAVDPVLKAQLAKVFVVLVL